ncbi:MAG: PadR family transcriptional regulator [Chloroflexi bacterium]|nr:PadR family transcriptional regulator [Chloroflexota bacterium]
MTDVRDNQPLTPAVFHILLALSSGDRHGYAIMKQVDADSQGRVTMGPGTLYGSLKRMLDAGLVVESGERIEPAIDDKRRVYYAISGAGSQALGAELERYRRLVELTSGRGLTPITLADG